MPNVGRGDGAPPERGKSFKKERKKEWVSGPVVGSIILELTGEFYRTAQVKNINPRSRNK